MVYRAPGAADEGDLYTGSRVCRKCGQRQPVTVFYWLKRDRNRVRTCHTCTAQRQRERVASDPKRQRETGFVRRLRVVYGLTPEEWQRLLEAQGRRCAICHDPLDRDNTHVDHCHATDTIRGLLCFTCNTGLGKFRDRADLLLAAADYLLSPPPEVHHRPRELSAEERALARRIAAVRWHRSPVGRATTAQRSQQLRGENGATAKLSDAQRQEICARYAAGETQYQLAEVFGVSQTGISRIVRGAAAAGMATSAGETSAACAVPVSGALPLWPSDLLEA